MAREGSPVVVPSVSSVTIVHPSDLIADNFSESTIPQLLQINSPVSGSVITVLSLLHEGQTSEERFILSMLSFDFVTNILFEGNIVTILLSYHSYNIG